MKNLLKYIYRLSGVAINVSGACFLAILVITGLGRLVNPGSKIQPDFTAITTPGWTAFWATALCIYLMGSLFWLIYLFIKNDNKETK